MNGYRRYPIDSEFIKELQIKDIYNLRTRNYLLESIENYNRKELINAENYTIEHILPQNPNIPEAWKKELGDDWAKIREKYLHSLGNLTLTGYNSELSDKPFSDKKSIPGGFNSSPLYLNESVRRESIWNEDAILRRASILSARAIKIWKRPTLNELLLLEYAEPEDLQDVTSYGIERYEFLKGDMLELYKQFEKRVLNLDSTVRVEFKKLYIAFKASTNFVDAVPQKKKLRLSLNMDFENIKDPKGLCKNVSDLGRWGNGDVEIGLSSINELDYVMELVQQAFDTQFEGL